MRKTRSAVAAFRAAAALALAVSALAGAAVAGTTPPATPEVDPGSLAGAAALLTGGVLLLTDRRGRQRTE